MTSESGHAVLVLGAGGQIGGALVPRLLAGGNDVVALRRTALAEPPPPRLRRLAADLTAGPLALGTKLEACVHATGLWLLPPHLEALAGAGVRRLVAFSSTSPAGKAGTQSVFERAQLAAIAVAERALAERCPKLGIATTILRPTLVYGAGRDRNITAAARFIARFGVYPLAGAARGLRQPVHADDLAAAAVAALATPAAAGRVYDLAGGETLAYAEMIGRIFDALGRRRRRIPLPTPLLAALAASLGALSGNPVLTAEVARRMARDLVFDDSDARRDLAWTPRPFLSNGRADLGM